jgi:hypothetical protein
MTEVVSTSSDKKIIECLNRNDRNECVICLEPLNTFLTTLPCGHVYHSACIIEYFQVHNIPECPLCRRIVGPPRPKQQTGEATISQLDDSYRTTEITIQNTDIQGLRQNTTNIHQRFHRTQPCYNLVIVSVALTLLWSVGYVLNNLNY